MANKESKYALFAVIDAINQQGKEDRIKARKGHSPAILGKGGPMKDKTKYTRKEKHSVRDTERSS